MSADINNVGDLGDTEMLVHADDVGNPVEDPEDQEVCELLEFASSMVEASMADVSVSNLETAIFLFREALEQCPPSHRLRLQLLKGLSGALGVSFMHRWKPEDLQDSLSLRTELAEGLRDTGGIMSTLDDEGDDEISDMIKLAQATISEYRQAVVLSDLETAILLFENALALSPSANSIREKSLVCLAEALFLRFCHEDDLHDITSAISHLREALEICPVDHPIYFLLNHRLSCMSGERFNRTNQLSDLEECLSCGSTQIHTPDNSPLDISKLLYSLINFPMFQYAFQLMLEFSQSSNLDQLNTAITIFQEGVSTLPALSDLSVLVLQFIATGLDDRFRLVGNRKDLDEAISIHQNLLPHLPLGHPRLYFTIVDLARSLSCRYDQDAKQEDLDMCIRLNKQALEISPLSDPERQRYFYNTARKLHTRYGLTGQRDDLEEAIELHRQGVAILPSAYPGLWSSFFFLLASSLSDSGDIKDLDEAIILLQQGLEICPPLFQRSASSEDLDSSILVYREALDLRLLHHSDDLSCIQGLLISLRERYEILGVRSDLDEAILLSREAMRLLGPSHPLRTSFFQIFTSILISKFEQDEMMEDLEEAILLGRTALELQPLEDFSLGQLASALRTRFEVQGQRKDLHDAISYHREALNLRPLLDSSLVNLAACLSLRFDEYGQRSDLDESIALLRQALEFQRSYMALDNLGNRLYDRFIYYEREHGDLEEAIMLHREALKLIPPSHQYRGCALNNLANKLHKKFDEDNHLPSLEESILLQREAVDFHPSRHTTRSICLSNLAANLCRRFEVAPNQEPTLLYEATRLYQESLEILPLRHVARWPPLVNFGNLLVKLFKLDRQRIEYLDQAIGLHREALTLVSADHAERSNISCNLAKGLITLYDERHRQDPLNDGLLDEAMGLLREAAEAGSSSPYQRFSGITDWAHEADRHGHLSAMDAYESAIGLLPQLAALSSDTQSRQKALNLRGNNGLAQSAAAYAIKLGELERAVEFLEAGRAVFWAQALQLRTPMDTLKEINPDLEYRLRNIALSLESASHEGRQAEALDNQTKMKADSESIRLRGLNDEWNAALDEARQMKGFENFLKPRKFSDLRVAALNGPIVMVVPDEYATHILILTENSIKYFSCSKLPLAVVRALVDMIQIAIRMSSSFISSEQLTALRHIITASSLLSTVNVELRNYEFNASERAGHKVRPAENWITQDKLFKFVLAILWDQIVKPIVDVLELQKSDRLETLIRWCLTGPFTFLPVHAAGFYGFDPDPFKMLAVIQSDTLPATKHEMEVIEQHVPPSCLTKLGVPGTPAGVEDVASHLSSASIAHFACHGIQDPFNPLESALILDDGELKISRIMKKSLPNASLAFLCACETAMGDQKLPDEMVSLAAALLYSGFSNVVGTMWSIADEDGPSVADAFYEHLLRDKHGRLDTKKTAKALHIAVKSIRDKNVPFLRWVPFIHLSR
ncbi:CHAT domain-containing protein [Crucibulum laeve]|uniref:CHAT domain-containing protein n=1 Tax=Crucibulum laeve TaxID=68775 RepID=A0A5C3LMZ4_9AGAR|nr:CHAT domain-containing protein [Crucibulum laeve]